MLTTILNAHPEWFQAITNDLDQYQVQILYTKIHRTAAGTPFFESYHYNLDENRYFYPASTIKLPIVLLTLEKLNELSIEGVNMHTTMLTNSALTWQSAVVKDSTAASGLPSIAHYIKKILLVSDNDAYNRLYEFLGYDYINQKLQEKGYKHTYIIHRLEQVLSEEENKITNPIRFVKDEQLIYHQPMQKATLHFGAAEAIHLGKGEMIGGMYVNQPKTFTNKNRFSIKDQQLMLRAVLFPSSIPHYQRFNLTPEQIDFVKRWMSALPRESEYPQYDTTQYFDSYVKFFMFGDDRKPMPTHIKIYNKVGDAYGFLIDNAYIVDEKNKVEFLLTACVHVNANQIYNDDQYEYETIGFPFMANLGRAIYQYELSEK